MCLFNLTSEFEVDLQRVAAALQGHNRSDTAIEYYQKALEMDPSMWQALAGEAMCYARRATKDDYKEAMRLQTLALELLDKIQPGVATDDSLKQGRHDGLERLGSYHVVLGDTNEAVEAYESALRETNRCSPCVNALLKLYRGKKHHKGIIELLKRMDENIEGLKYTRLSESLITKANYERTNGYFEIIAHAAAVENEIGFLYGIYESAIQVAQKQHKSLEATHLELCLAALYNRHGRPELAAKIWESIATTYHNINTLKSEYALAGVKFDAKISLARHCLKQAVECGKDSKEAQEYGTKLKDLTKVKTDTEITIGGSAVARMLGSWYSFMGQDEKARQCFRGELIEGLRMLADDDPSNDVVAYANLGSILTAAGDYKNAMAMYWKAATIATKMYAEQEQANDTEESNTEISIEKEHLQAKDFCCDACFRRTNGPVAICRYCFDIGFCEQCFTAFKAGNLQVDICSPKHSWGMIHARSKEAREDTEPDKLWLDGEHISIHDWKERLAAEWNI